MFSSLSSIIFFLATSSFLTSFNLVSAAPTSLTVRQDNTDTNWARGVYIAAVGAGDQCLSAADGNATSGTQVITTTCQNASTWTVPLMKSGGAVVHEGSGLTIDLGEANNRDKLTLQSYTGSATQVFVYGSNNRLFNNGTQKCIDQDSTSGPQVYTCYAQSTNQAWLIRKTPEPQSLDDIPKGQDLTPPNTDLSFIHPQGRKDICVSAISKEATPQAGDGVALTYCAGTGFVGSGYNTSQDLMQWSLPSTNQTGQVKLGSSGLCLETATQGSYGADGMALRLNECQDQSEDQESIWDGLLLKSSVRSSGGDQCLNFAAEAGYVKMDNFLNLRPLQTWGCSNTNENELFEI
ncbi:uncharacterized protein I303_103861 [Kwoniella dejecticola CBS 10117]|uniref:Ricin B lectin domain-containing protein n=1 Tax=Kwoniella dejecticola CBS 10117 TaxID=1296121 RepID=A0A1A6A7X7_9TREE|nr:uncharacterized protein I303_03880 [Kwoniella dejecticola CBS 10117]OBR86160.1 hypothetical protein I303_03880 [Kwoniella dejecticola CBS 10117]